MSESGPPSAVENVSPAPVPQSPAGFGGMPVLDRKETTGLFSGDGLFFVLAGGLILGAFFMATDYVTSPLSARGKILFGLGCGILTFLIRKYSIYPEGVCYAILAMNALTPWLDKVTYPKWRGYKK